MVQFLPDDALSPFLRGPDVFGVDSVFRPQEPYVRIGRHLAEGPGHVLRAFHAHAAPPEDGLDALGRGQAAVVSQDGPQLRVHPAFYGVVRRRERPLRRQRGVEVREQRARVDQGDDPPTRFAQALVRVDEPAVDEAPPRQEARPEAAPPQEALGPPFGPAQGLDMQELLRQRVELDARLELGSGRRLPLDLAEHVEQAPLDPGARPFGRDRLGEPAPAVGDHHVGRGHAG